jgi:hypothetical protein
MTLMMMRKMLKPYIALYVEREYPLEVMGFVCQAEDTDHAEEQCLDAYPGADVVWVEEGVDMDKITQRYWDITSTEDE